METTLLNMSGLIYVDWIKETVKYCLHNRNWENEGKNSTHECLSIAIGNITYWQMTSPTDRWHHLGQQFQVSNEKEIDSGRLNEWLKSMAQPGVRGRIQTTLSHFPSLLMFFDLLLFLYKVLHAPSWPPTCCGTRDDVELLDPPASTFQVHVRQTLYWKNYISAPIDLLWMS